MTDTRSPRRWWALLALVPAVLAVGLDGTVLSVALPTLARELHASTDQLQWFVIGYTLAFAAALIPAGMLGDRVGRRRTLLVALAAFGLGSVGCAYAGSAAALIGARVLLGLGGAAIFPMALGALPTLFDDDERPRATALLMTMTMLGYPVGPILGGWLLSHAWWGWVFLMNVPVVLTALVAVSLLMPESRDPGGSRQVDVLGILTSSAALGALSYGITEVGRKGWGDVPSLGFVGAGLALGAVFLAWEQRTPAPLVDLRLFAARGFSAGTALGTVVSFVMFGLLFTVPEYAQAVSGADAQGGGLRLLPLLVGLLATAAAGERLTRRIGARPTVAAGFVVLAAGMAWGATTGVGSGDVFLASWTLLCGAGLGLAMPTAMDAALGSLDPASSGTGSGVLQAVRMVGGSLGAAVLGSVLNAGFRADLPAGVGPLAGLPGPLQGAARDGVDGALALSQRLHSPALADVARQAFVSGLGSMLVVAAAMALVGAALTVAFLPNRAGKAPRAAGSEHDPAPVPVR